ncbi:hypothetical protein ACIQSP_19835 [Streptomyces nigra]|uniref:hypothetical protein n=1 Tax=Streptomyces nigra TaxID=1827580 RepID=UPI00381A8D9A
MLRTPSSDTPSEGHDAPDSYRRVAEALVEELGWDRATFVATAVRGFIYGSPSAGPYRDQAADIYERLGWEQAALLAAWFRDTRSRPGRLPTASSQTADPQAPNFPS